MSHRALRTTALSLGLVAALAGASVRTAAPQSAAKKPLDDPTIVDFIQRHEKVFLVEQNRDAQLRTLVMNECGIDPARLVAVLHYDGTPITARFITEQISSRLGALKVAPLREVAI